MVKLPSFTLKLQGQLFIVAISLIAIVVSVIFQMTDIVAPEIPLLIAIILGGIPVTFHIILKLVKRDLGADSLAAIALITAVILNQYLAAVIIILMVASGQALEALCNAKSILCIVKRIVF